jgi:asparagine synthase (glutamine-hydrolysing)
MQYLDLKTYLPNDLLTKLDVATMHYSLEGRVPFLDHELIELAFTIPAQIRNPNGELKGLLKRCVHPLLPRRIMEKKKQGFSAPWYRWLNGNVESFLEPFCDSVLNRELLIDRQAVSGNNLWPVMVLNRWLTRRGVA